jgi:hypothetical protein
MSPVVSSRPLTTRFSPVCEPSGFTHRTLVSVVETRRRLHSLRCLLSFMWRGSFLHSLTYHHASMS